MFSKKFSSNIRKRKRMITAMVILLVVCLGIGYSAFSTNLGINGTLNVSKYDQTLYGVLEKAAKKGTYAKEYTGEHHDSFTEEPSKKIYHWYGSNDSNGTAILDMNNVIFADHCWQMIRTTDTGGVKMVYNGEPENGQCLNTRGNHVGYGSRTTQSMSTTYYYGTSYTYDKTNNVFSLDGTVTTGTIQLGQYTCKQTTADGTCATLYLVDTLSSGTTYYVLPLNSNSNYSQFGTLQFNQSYDSPSYVGYMYNTVYPIATKTNDKFQICTARQVISDNRYYSEAIDYGNITPGKYTLINPKLISTLSDYSSLVGKYVGSDTGTSSYSVIYVIGVENNIMSYKQLSNGDQNTSLTVGDSYTKSGNIYTLTNPTNVTYIDWYSNTNDYGTYKGKYVCDGNNTSCSILKHIYSGTNPNDSEYYYISTESTYSYSESVNYNGGTYTLSGDIKTFWDLFDSTNQGYLPTHHYTCLENGTTCTTLGYVYYIKWNIVYYAKIQGTIDVSTALNNMLNVDSVNQQNSTIKTGIDTWYKRYMTSHTSKLEDVIFCNERIINSLGAWNPNGGEITNSSSNYLTFKSYVNTVTNVLKCTNTVDSFSLSNTKARLTYPVGLLTSGEIRLLSNQNVVKTGEDYWIMSPYVFNFEKAYIRAVYDSGNISSYNGDGEVGVRPAISLKPGTEYTSGSGSMADPYVVE